MSKPESRGPDRAPLPKARVNAFFHHLGRDLGADEYSDRSDDRACVEKNLLVQAGRRRAIFRTDTFWTSRV
jgi:hypothetical protein